MMSAEIIMTEDMLLKCFQVMKGGHGHFLGVKSPWWAKFIEYEEPEVVKVYRWQPNAYWISLAEKVILDALLKLSEHDRKVLWLRCGNGRKTRSYRKCGSAMGYHHEMFRQQYQRVMITLQKILDEM